MIATLGALAGAAMRTTSLIEALEQRAASSRPRRARAAAQCRGVERRRDAGRQPSPWTRLRREIALVAASDLSVLITGETGVGKELVAHHVHAASARADEAMIHVNCAALPLSIAESELFGHVGGRVHRRVARSRRQVRGGRRRHAACSTRSASCRWRSSPSCCACCSTARSSGWDRDRAHRVNVRVIAATNRDLAREVSSGPLPRGPLSTGWQRFHCTSRRLRERRADIPCSPAHFADAAARRLGLAGVRLTDRARQGAL